MTATTRVSDPGARRTVTDLARLATAIRRAAGPKELHGWEPAIPLGEGLHRTDGYLRHALAG